MQVGIFRPDYHWLILKPLQQIKAASEYGALRRIRTSDRSVRSRVLYPAELRMQNGGEAGIRTPDAAFDRILP